MSRWDYRDRERALTEALVTAQEMREEMRKQAVLEAELAKRTAEQQAEHLRSSAEAEVRQLRSSAQQKASEELASLREERQREEQVVRELRARREEFLGNYRAFLEQELEELGVIARAAGSSLRRSATGAGSETGAVSGPSGSGAGTAATASGDARRGSADAGTASAAGIAAGAAAAPSRPAAPPSAASGTPSILDELPSTETGAASIDAESALAGSEPLVRDETQPDVASAEDDVEPFEPEPFLDDETPDVIDAWEAEAAVPVEGASGGASDETEVSGGGTEEKLYDGIAGDEDGDGVPGPIGLGAGDPWDAPDEWSIADLQLVEQNDGDALDLGGDDDTDEDDEEMQRLLRNAAAAGYNLDDEPATEELLLDEAVPETDVEPKAPSDDGWLPTLLEDDK
jgi:hypothetical protein